MDLVQIGVGPWVGPWPDDERYDPVLLAEGDRRNVVDRYRYWRLEAVVVDLDSRRHAFHVAVENWQHDMNIGSVVRCANAFNAAGVHIVGDRRFNLEDGLHPNVKGVETIVAGILPTVETFLDKLGTASK